ncbi:MAG: histidine kinase [Mucilaginibacter sp.]|nr:histidine kinase [Mucilaginibacter sp.]
MAKYQRIRGGEKNEKTGVDWTRIELEEVCQLYLDLDGKNIHENNPKIHLLAEKLDRTVRSVENQLLGFRKVASSDTGRKNYNSLIPQIWEERVLKVKQNLPVSNDLIDFKAPEHSEFRFRVSSQLKNIIGKDLILDDNIALFELVKNSYDAHAKNVKIIFENDSLTIIDDGKGMSREDLLNKWLFVAYSAKKEGKEDTALELDNDYRDKISGRPAYAGAKGIGRFSTDRLGSKLILISKSLDTTSGYEQLFFDWDTFEIDSQNNFNDININHKNISDSGYENFNHGLILKITDLRNAWTHDKLLELKWSLEKLINPFQSAALISEFNIEIIAPKFKENDDNNENPRFKINGYIRNFIFDTLDIKTTQIKSSISEDGEMIFTELIDRGQIIYKIGELNPFRYLSNVDCNLFYLNTSAKTNFTRLMGIRPTEFGSIFLFNKGFRVYPIGEPNNDPFNIDKRKVQGRSRYLGTRELIGRIELKSDSEYFVETTSREGGLIQTPGVDELERYFKEKILLRLERYVVDIQWPLKDQADDLSLLSGIDSKRKIIELINKLVDNDYIELLEYSKDFFNVINEKNVVSTPEIFDQLRILAEKRGDLDFANEIDISKEEFIKLKKAKDEEEKKRIEEENKRIEAERLIREAEERALKEEEKRKEEEYQRLKAEEELREERAKRIAEEQRTRQRESQVRFLESVQSLEIEDVLNLNHQIGIDANSIEQHIVNFTRKLNTTTPTNEEIKSFLDKLSYASKKILAVVKFTTKENFMAAARKTNDDIILFYKSYILNILKHHIGSEIDIQVLDLVNSPFIIDFKPIELTIIIDNLLSNSKRKNAKKVVISFVLDPDGSLNMVYRDYGDGLDKSIDDPNNIFERGYTTTKGSGLGLAHIKRILDEIHAQIKVNANVKPGIEFTINFKK